MATWNLALCSQREALGSCSWTCVPRRIAHSLSPGIVPSASTATWPSVSRLSDLMG